MFQHLFSYRFTKLRILLTHRQVSKRIMNKPRFLGLRAKLFSFVARQKHRCENKEEWIKGDSTIWRVAAFVSQLQQSRAYAAGIARVSSRICHRCSFLYADGQANKKGEKLNVATLTVDCQKEGKLCKEVATMKQEGSVKLIIFLKTWGQRNEACLLR